MDMEVFFLVGGLCLVAWLTADPALVSAARQSWTEFTTWRRLIRRHTQGW